MPKKLSLFKFWGKVKTHNKRGRDLGFPTANLSLHKNIPEGIYISFTKVDGRINKSVTFIGSAKTFNENKIQAETYILDFNRDIYNKWISVKLIKKIRANKKFKSAGELVKQMKKDEEEARKYFSLAMRLN